MYEVFPRRAVATALGLAALVVTTGSAPANPRVRANDNTKPAGRMSGDTLRLRLVMQMADWAPESDTGPVIQVAAFSEEGEAPSIPAPLIRVREGTVIAATIRNALTDSTITLIGFGPHTGRRDTLAVLPGETQSRTFVAAAPGTYLYRARIGIPKGVEWDQTGGAFVVDPPGGSPTDRIFVINIWGAPVDSTRFSNALALNGRSWPHTERMQAVVGDTLRWRVVNATDRPHPMHLHGAYFRVDSKGHQFADTTYAPEQRRLVVTEDMRARQTMTMVWAPVNEGRWLFHCHITFHVAGNDARLVPVKHAEHHDEAARHEQHMAGLVIGIDAKARPGVAQAGRGRARRLDLFVQEGKRRARFERSMGFVLQRGATPPRPDSTVLPGSLIVLTRGEPTDITVHNRLKEATSVHWHGLELESFSDGVAFFGGSPGMTTPAVMPGTTFTARLSSPRAGTFIYHTHMRDEDQLLGGLYGPIVVLEPGQRFDSARDHVHIVGWDADKEVQLLVNGDSLTTAPIAMRVGEKHRFRFINIGMAEPAWFTIKRDTTVMQWTPLAKDGADLPASQRAPRKASLVLDVGQTYDAEFTPAAAGEYVLSTPTDFNGRRWSRRIVVR
jgi:FtsP/CotA-like multicopper oxidase with cupredoxin domain